METKQKNRPDSAKPQRRSTQPQNGAPRRTADVQPQQRKKGAPAKKAAGNPLQALFGKSPKKQRPAPRTQTRSVETARQQEAERQRQSLQREEERLRRQAAAQREAQQRAENMEAAQQNIPEAVFNTAQQSHSRTAEDNRRSQVRRNSAKRAQERKKLEVLKKKRPTVAYTPPKPVNLNHLLLQLAVVVGVVVAIVLGLSVFFRVENVVIYGNNAYSAWTIQEASGIERGENLLTFGRPRACGKIITALPYVENVRIGIKLPNTVNIYITEYDVAYAIASDDGTWWLMSSDGKLMEQIDSGIARSYTKVLGVELNSPQVGAQAVAMEVAIPETPTTAADATQVTSPVTTVMGADRLRAAKLILRALEKNEIVGEAASVDVTRINNIELMYGQRYQVKLGDTNQMDKKISQMKQAISQFNDYQSGILDVSYTTWPDGPFFTPFE